MSTKLSQREFVGSAAFAGAAVSLVSKTVLAEEKADGKKALFVWGGWEGHEPGRTRDIFVPWMRKVGFNVIVSNTLDSYADADLMDSIDLVVQAWTMGEISKDQSNGLITAVKRCVGLAGWHGGLCDSFHQNTGYQFMTGG